MQIVVDDLLTSYSLQGNGKLVVVLHGWGDSSQGSLALQARLAKKYQVLAFDLPGFGQTQVPPTAWNLDDYANFTQQLLQKLQFKKVYAIIGHSNGGAVAIRGLALKSLDCEKLILLAAAGNRSPGNFRRRLLQAIAKTGKLVSAPLPKATQTKLRRRLYGAAGSDMLLVEGLQETFKRTVRQDVQADAATIAQPTLLIYGANDAAVPVSHGQRYQQLIAKARLEIISGAGHFVYLDQPTVVSDLIEEFLR